jgi:hypothetical protein
MLKSRQGSHAIRPCWWPLGVYKQHGDHIDISLCDVPPARGSNLDDFEVAGSGGVVRDAETLVVDGAEVGAVPKQKRERVPVLEVNSVIRGTQHG